MSEKLIPIVLTNSKIYLVSQDYDKEFLDLIRDELDKLHISYMVEEVKAHKVLRILPSLRTQTLVSWKSKRAWIPPILACKIDQLIELINYRKR